MGLLLITLLRRFKCLLMHLLERLVLTLSHKYLITAHLSHRYLITAHLSHRYLITAHLSHRYLITAHLRHRYLITANRKITAYLRDFLGTTCLH